MIEQDDTAGRAGKTLAERRALLTFERVSALLALDTQTGVLTWKVNRPGAPPAGSVAGTRTSHGYIQLQIDGVLHYAHRLVWLMVHGAWPLNDVDHINGIGSDNRPSNLRDVTREVNLQNLRRARCTSTTGLLGVSPSSCGQKWVARIKTRGEVRRLGTFETAEQAHAAYVAAKREDHEGCTL